MKTTTISSKFAIFIIVLFLIDYNHIVLAKSPIPSGTWLTEDGRARVRTEPCGPRGDSLCGYVVWIQNQADQKGQARFDQNNPDPAKRSRPVLGHQLFGLKSTVEGRFSGRIYNADTGKYYDVEVWSEQSSELNVRGCMLAFFCGSQTWMRVMDVLPGQLQALTDTPGGPRADREWAAKAVVAPGTTTPKSATTP